MAKYEVAYSCGHYGIVNLFGKEDDRKKRIAWMSNGVCPECYRKSKMEEMTDRSPVVDWIFSNYCGQYWNGKIYDAGVRYGKPAKVYLDGKEVEIPEDVYNAQKSWHIS